ncbi:1,4-alpha-glucan branching enzyme [Albimonas pacifica]|uniref:1,4-alpha-glucan branching enzyme GlgB n=1 Tax=Albimonas pacifica TaxID=1114924 RepID=A0A1I3H0I7_9RHOB|nr:1,4-alpha-glucan branching enzyme [Albimonas pacifica]
MEEIVVTYRPHRIETGAGPLIPTELAERIAQGRQSSLFDVLGAHPQDDAWRLAAFVPGAERVEAIDLEGETFAELSPQGADVFAALLDARPEAWNYRAWRGGTDWEVKEVYRFAPILGELDEHLFAEGAHGRLWDVLGAHVREHEGVQGTSFAVWAPSARRVSVVGDFNDWDGRRHVLRPRGSTGVWEIFIPAVGDGARYKYELLGPDWELLPPKSDPVGFGAEMRPDNCSVVRDLRGRKWRDAAWMESRAARQSVDAPISIYEAHLPSWKKKNLWEWLSWRDLAEQMVPYVAEMGFTHIEALPITEHPFDGSWGYQPVGLYAPTSRLGGPHEFRDFVEACHAAGLGLILDWVPAHFPSDAHGLAKFDGTHLYEHDDPRQGYHPDWNTLIYNLGRREVANFLAANGRYWLTEHHVDGLRVDAVASMLYRDYSRKPGEWVPNRDGGRENWESVNFLRRVNAEVYGDDPSVMTIAEESTAWPGVSKPVHDGGLGFGFKWNMGWMHDTLQYIERDPIHRRHHHGEISFGLHYAFSENFVLPISHDEVVHGKGSMLAKMPGDMWGKFANLRAYYAFMFGHPGKKLLFMGQEFGQATEWNHETSVDWDLLADPKHDGLRKLVRDLNHLYRDAEALHKGDCREDGFRWVDGSAEAQSVYAWLRLAEGAKPVLCVYNFSGAQYDDWRIGVPAAGAWRTRVNSDAQAYGGAGRGPSGTVQADAAPAHGFEHSLKLSLPPLTGMIFELEG